MRFASPKRAPDHDRVFSSADEWASTLPTPPSRLEDVHRMRIAYVAPYQGRTLQARRPIVGNLGLAANVKIELVSELLEEGRHDVEIFSQGAVVEPHISFYPGFREPQLFHPAIPVSYASALPIRRLNGAWSAFQTLRLFARRHRKSPFDVLLIWNLQFPQIVCALYAMRRLQLPVILEHEDDALVDIAGGQKTKLYRRLARHVLGSVSGCIGVSPHILTRVRADIPQLLLRGLVSGEIVNACREGRPRKDWVVYSGTHFRWKGLEQLVKAWVLLDLPQWELHIAGHGEKTDTLKRMTEGYKNVVFHGLLDRAANAELLTTAKIGMNPHDVSATPGNLFAFKIVEYLAAGLHVITTPMGDLEGDLEAGITYIAHNAPETIAAALREVITKRQYERTATDAAQGTYGPTPVARSLNALVTKVVGART